MLRRVLIDGAMSSSLSSSDSDDLSDYTKYYEMGVTEASTIIADVLLFMCGTS